MEVAVDLAKVIINENSGAQVIVLQERDGPRAFPIVIGFFEAAAIERKINERSVPRPMTHDLLESVVGSLGASHTQTVICDLKDGTFYAVLRLARDGEVLEVDSRPSDAIALAVRTGAEILVDERVFDALPGE